MLEININLNKKTNMIIKPLFNIKRQKKQYVTFNGVSVNADDVFFLDVETAPEYPNLGELLKHNPVKYDLFIGKYKSLKKFDVEYAQISESQVYENYTGLMAEYCKVVCISFGYVTQGKFNCASIAIDNVNFHSEREVLENFAAILAKSKKKYVCGANIMLFDIPLLCKKFFSYGIMPPPALWSHEIKPWLATAIDICEIWRGKARMRDARLITICNLMGIESPKTDMEGKDVGKFFYDGKIEDIATYCEKDTFACYQVFIKFQELEYIS